MNKKYFIGLMAILILLVVALIYRNNDERQPYIHNEGKIHGTFYTATYQHPKGEDLQPKIEVRMKEFELSLSTYNPASIISRINNNESDVALDDFFVTVYNKAVEVSDKTGGAFDMTVGPLVKAWGFGFGASDTFKMPDIEKIMPFIGYNKVKMQDNRIVKQFPETRLDASAIAKGYSSDVIAKLFEAEGCENYMIEIGGEVACKGLNPKGKKWHIGIDKPIEDAANVNSELQTIVAISGVGLATSGNYRQFYYRDGKRYAHTIDPRTGFPVQHNLLSATVIAPTCMQADAYATAFMVLGVDESLRICDAIENMECYLIFSNEKGEYEVKMTDGFKQYIAE